MLQLRSELTYKFEFRQDLLINGNTVASQYRGTV